MTTVKIKDRSVSMRCPVCGNDQFGSVCENKLKCSDCGAVIRKDALIEANGEAIETAADEMVADALKDFEKQMKMVMKKWK